MNRQWHVVTTKPRQEALALIHLQRQSYQVWLPLTRETQRHGGRLRERIVPLFSRYLFVHVDSELENTAPIRSTLGCNGLLRFGQRVATVPSVAVEAIRSRQDDDGYVRLDPSDDWKPGQLLKITHGPFLGFDAVFQARTGKERVEVLMQWMGSQRVVELAAGSVCSA